MKRSLLINLTLLAGVICLWWWLQQPQKSTFSLGEVVNKPVTDILIQRPAQADIRLQQNDSHWYLTQPLKSPASANRVALLLDLLEQPLTSQIKANHDLARFGFDEKSIRLQFNHTSMIIGGRAPLTGQRYLLYDDTVFVTADRSMPLLSAGVSSFIAHQPLTTRKTIARLSLPGRHRQQLTPARQTYTANNHAALIKRWQQATAVRVQLNSADLLPAGRPVIVSYTDGSTAHFYLRSGAQLTLSTADGALDYIFPATMLDVLIPATD